MNKQYLLTGATSQLGRYIVSMLIENGDKVRVLVPQDEDRSCFDGIDVEIFEGEIFQKDSMKEFFTLESPREAILIHADERVSIAHNKDLLMRRTNVTGAVNVTDMCIRHRIGRMVFLSSAYALPSTNTGYVSGTKFHFDRNHVEGDYAQTKAEASAYVMEKVSLNKFDAVLVLPTFMIGPGFTTDSDIGKILDGYLHKEIAPVQGGHVFVDVRDVAAGVIAAAQKGETGAGYILTGEYRTTVEFFQDVNEVSSLENPSKVLPNWLLSKPASLFVDTYYRLIHKENPKDVYALFMTSPETHYESGDAAEVLDISHIDIKKSIEDTVNWAEHEAQEAQEA